jgi:hypothetical protein
LAAQKVFKWMKRIINMESAGCRPATTRDENEKGKEA